MKLLRSLSEKGGGNFYFVEDPSAMTEVFTEELSFFVAPLAYDLDLTFEVFLESRTSTAPGPSGIRVQDGGTCSTT